MSQKKRQEKKKIDRYIDEMSDKEAGGTILMAVDNDLGFRFHSQKFSSSFQERLEN
jgi:hypothetical protein